MARAHAAVTPDTIAKILFTSGSTGKPKGVINTQRMLSANQEMLRTVMPFLRDEPPVLCDWLPWNHTFGGNHNFGIVLYNGGTLYIDAGRPTPTGFEHDAREPARDCDDGVFQRAAGLRAARARAARGRGLPAPLLQPREHAVLRGGRPAAAGRRRHGRARGRRVRRTDRVGHRTWRDRNGAVRALHRRDGRSRGRSNRRAGARRRAESWRPVGSKWEARLRGPNVTPGYWRDAAHDARRVRRGRVLPVRRRGRLRRRPRSCRKDSRSKDGWPKTSSCRPAPGCASDRFARACSPRSAIWRRMSSSRRRIGILSAR